MSKIIKYDCPFCDKEHEVKVMEHEVETVIKDQKVKYIQKSYYCPLVDDEFMPEEIMNENLLVSKEAYRKQNGLLTVCEIKEIRKIYDLTQREYANLLGVGEITIQRYEKKSIQDTTYDMLMRLTKDNPNYCLQMLEKNRNRFSMERYIEVRNRIFNRIKAIGEDYLARESIEMKYIEYFEPTEENGFCKLNIDKIEAILNYIAYYMDNIYKVKMMKLLWYIDQVSFKKYGHAITGLVYQHMPLGALPIAHYDLMKLSSINVEEEEHDEYTAYKINAQGDIQTSLLSSEEVSLIQKVIDKFRNYSTKEIVNYMHKEKAYKQTNNKEVICFLEELLINEFE